MTMNIMNWNIQQDGNDYNGGGYKQGGTTTNYSLQANPQVVFDGTTIKIESSGVTPVMQLTGYVGLPVDSGNVVHIMGGSNATPGWYEIQNIQSINGSGWYIADRNWCTGAVINGSGVMGGALASVGGLGALLATDTAVRTLYSRAWMKYSATPYALASSSYNVPSGGYQHLTAWNFPFAIMGYESVMGVAPTTRPKILVNTFNPVNGVIYCDETEPRYGINVAWLIIDGNLGTANVGFQLNTGQHGGLCYECVASGCDSGFLYSKAVRCEVLNCGTGGFVSSSLAWKCSAHHNAGIGFSSCAHAIACLGYSNTGVGFNACINCINCVAVNNIGDGFDLTVGAGMSCINCLSEKNTGYGFDFGGNFQLCKNCFTYLNGGEYRLAGVSINYLSPITGFDNITELTADPLEDSLAGAGHEKYWLNDVANGGALLRGAGTKMLDTLSPVVDAPDLAATQHADTPSTSTYFII